MFTKPHLLVTKSVLKCNWLLLLKSLVTLSNSHFDTYVDQLIVLIVSPVCIVAQCHPTPPLWKTQIPHQPLHCRMVNQSYRASKKR